MKISLIGNCQTKALTWYIEQLNENFDVKWICIDSFDKDSWALTKNFRGKDIPIIFNQNESAKRLEDKDHNFEQFFAYNRFGWGFDVVMCAISYILGLPVIRDANHIIEHSLQTNYNKQQAQQQYNETKRKLPQEIKQYIHHTLDTGERFRFLNCLDI
jgi:hypothetical protein